MALSATFTANFSSFYDAVAKADKALVDFGAGADTVGKKLDKFSNQFSGKAIVQEAALMVRAVEDIGGTSKLTEKELAKLGATTNEAVEKMKKLGMDVPANLQKIADETKGATKASTDWTGSLKTMATAAAAAFSVGAITNFIGSVFDAAGAVADLADQWGVSTRAVQQWTQAAKLSGVESDTVGKSIQFITQALEESSPEYDALLKNIGLSAAALRGMSTEDAYKTIIAGVSGIKDETLQLDVALGLVGPSSKKLIGAMRDGFLEAADAQTVMSDETIKRLAAAGDAWEGLKNKVIIYSGEMIGAIGKNLDKDAETWRGYWGNLKALAAGGLPGLADYRKAVEAVAPALTTVATAAKGTAAAGDTLTTSGKSTAQVLADLKTKTDAAAKADKDHAAAVAAASQALAAHNKAIQTLADTYTGKAIATHVADLTAALKLAEKQGGLTTYQHEQLGKELIKLKAEGANLTPELERVRQAEANLEDAARLAALAHGHLTDVTRNLRAVQLPAVKSTQDLTDEFNKHIVAGDKVGTMLDTIAPKIVKLPAPPPDPWREFKTIVGSTMDTLEGAVVGSFAQMALGAKGWHDGFIDILNSLKGAATRIVSDLMGSLTEAVFRGFANMLTGAGSFSSSFSGIVGKAIGGGASTGVGAATGGVGVAAGGGMGSGAAFAGGEAAAAGGGVSAGSIASSVLPWLLPVAAWYLDPQRPIDMQNQIDQMHAAYDNAGIGDYWNTPEGQAAQAAAQAAQDWANSPEGQAAAAADAAAHPVWDGTGTWPGPSFATGSGGFRNFGAGTPAMLHGWEAVVPRQDAGAFATVAAGAGPYSSQAAPAIAVTINAQGAFFETPDSLQRLAARVSDALTAKYSVMGKLRAAV